MKTKHMLFWGIIAIFSISQLSAQGFDGKTRWVAGFGIQEQDRRLYDWPQGNQKYILEETSWIPTWHLSIGLTKPILFRQDFSLDLGIGYGMEVNYFGRPLNRSPLREDPRIPFNLVFVDQYYIHMGYSSLSLSKRIKEFKNGSRLFVACDALGSANWLKWVRYGEANEKRILTDLYSFEINTGFGFEKDRFRINVQYRLWQTKQVDPVLFPASFYSSMPDDPYETYNPFKMWITVSRDLEEGWWKRKK